MQSSAPWTSAPVARRAAPVLCALSLVTTGCGAKTGLLVWETSAPTDAAEETFVRFDACVAGRFALVRRSAEIVFVIDRSGSMFAELDSGGSARGPSRWEAMRTVLVDELARYESTLDMGALFYPRVPFEGAAGSQQFCQLPPGGLDVEPGRMRAGEITSLFVRTSPSGGTPTAAAVRRATQSLRAREARGRAQYLVLATDGGPNCNGALDPEVCSCGEPPPNICSTNRNGALFCLDAEGAIESVRDAARQGVQTYVLGIDGDLAETQPEAVDVLDRMAVAGGRALPAGSPRRYYSIRDVPALRAAFASIQRTVAQCAFVTPSRPDDPDAIDVEWNGVRLPRDESRREGWDWTDRDYGEITFFGQTCERFIESSGTITATVRCRAR